MAWYHVYQFAEIRDPMYPRLRGKCLPIIKYEVWEKEKKIIAVQVLIKEGQVKWFHRKTTNILLYRSGSDLLKIEERYQEPILKRLWRNLHWREK